MLAQLKDYRALIALDEPFVLSESPVGTEMPSLVTQVLQAFWKETPMTAFVQRRASMEAIDQRTQLKVLLTLRRAEPFLSSDFHALMDCLLHHERLQRPLTQVLELPTVRDLFPEIAREDAERFVLWQGDITTLRVDAIVNAANSALVGCFQPLHRCIDNVIHSVAGPRLREDCQRIMTFQGEDEPTGSAKVTRGYHLPASFVLHTVGPIYPNMPPDAAQTALALSYRACLNLAAQLPAIRSLAFCCISTGVFGFPQRLAAEVATQTIEEWMTDHPDRFERIVWNVFHDEDYLIYHDLLTRRARKEAERR
jgi:O-acetyl-ADP-ribose deacetylase (regulator of RNase III)